MTSLQLVDFINSQRAEGAAVLAHSDFLKKVPAVLGGGHGKFSDTYRHPQNGQMYPCYRFPKRETCLMAMSYSRWTPQHIAQYRDARMTKARTLKDGIVIPASRATVAAKRELALFSTIFNKAREWGYTAKTNPCAGVAKNKETPRRYYADDRVWRAVRDCAAIELQDAMDLAYLSGQRPGDVLRFTHRDIVDDALTVQQGKTSKRLAIMLTDPDSGARSELGRLLDRIRARIVRSLWLLATPDGKRLTTGMLRLRFTAAREAAAGRAEKSEDTFLAARIRQFQFRDARPKAASEMALDRASDLLGHSDKQITKVVYQRVGKRVKPTK